MTANLELLTPVIGALFNSIVRASVEGGLFVLAVWALCRMLPRIPASIQCTLWWLCALKLLVAFVWVAPLPLPVLDPHVAESVSTERFSPGLFAKRLAMTTTPMSPAAPPARETPQHNSGDQVSVWHSLAVGLWAAIVIVLTGSLARRIRRITLMANRADPAPAETVKMAKELSASLRLAKTPGIRVSDEIDTPLVLCFPRPLVLVPAHRFPALSEKEQRMALCHELLHLRRRDSWLAHVPALAERLFFFHPLVHLATRRYELTREAACDAAVLEELGAAPRDYGRLLLTLGVTRMPTPLAAAGSPNSHLNLKRRIVMLRETSGNGRRLRKSAWMAAVLAVCAILPVDFVAKSAKAEDHRPASLAAGPAAPTKLAAPATPAAARSQAAVPAHPAVAAAVSNQASDLRYVLFLDDHHTMMSGSEKDVERARKFRKSGESILWFRRTGREYVVRDPGLLAEVQEIFKPLTEIGGDQSQVGAKQSAIGARQADVGRKQAEIGEKQAEIGALQSRVGSRQAAMATREAELRTSRQDKADAEAKERELEQEQRKLEAEMEQLGRKMEELNDQMKTFEAPMNELSKDMNVLSEEMNILGRKMKDAAQKAETLMSALLDRAISTGAAQAVQ